MIDEERDQEVSLSRRTFLGAAAAAGVALAACAGGEETKVIKLGEQMVPGPKIAPDGPVIKAGLIGCGGRGTGAAGNFLDAGPNLQVVALADVFDDRVQDCRGKLNERYGTEVADDRCYVGFDAYQQLIDSDVDYIIIATPPSFRPAQFKAAVEARKNIFMEKPLAVDPVGARSIFESAEKAEAFGLKIATGTQRRHERQYIETFNRVMDGAIGEIVAARCYWNQSQLWYKEREAGWTDMEWMIRDWVNWCWLSGDHIVEQHIHNIDVINWFTNSHPVKAVGMGGRHRRVTGDQYDSFSVDYEMENGVHVLSMCRQVDGCANNVSEFVVGTNGSSNCKDTIYGPDGEVVWTFVPEEQPVEGEEYDSGPNSPYVQEHIDLVTAIRTDQPINEARNTAISTLTAIMGRVSAYTGQEVTWDEMMTSEMSLGPSEYKMEDIGIEAVVPVPGAAKT
ncbi:MAG: Gfo/Idh/MocA family oxidoreductase [Acidobacteriota bacterium]|nr:MAG: Gfo/Idh/MocA family oxidoreductase [Acidobacteriota bacterium]